MGWTVSSLLVVDGEPGRLIGMLDPESDLADRLTTKDCFTVNLLGWQHRALGDVFAGTAPAPGGAFRQARWTDSDWGPVLDGAIGWVGARLDPAVPATELGWSLQVTAVIEHIELADAASGDPDALAFLRGRYRPLPLEADTPRSPGPGHR